MPHSFKKPVKFQGLYELTEHVMVRVPLLPIDFYQRLSDRLDSVEEGKTETWPLDPGGLDGDNSWITSALAVGSQTLTEALRRPVHSERDASQIRNKVIRYLCRMSTRPTPYGLFAGVALGRWGKQTNLALAAVPARTRTRLDTEWLFHLVYELESNLEIRKQLVLFANTAALVRAGRIFLSEPSSFGKHPQASDVSLRATGVARRALAAAREPIPYQELARILLASSPSATVEKVDRLIADLWEHSLLLTELRPPLTVDNPGRYVLQRLANITGVEDTRTRLTSILQGMERWDAEATEQRFTSYRQLCAEIGSLGSFQTSTPFQVDMAVELAGEQLNRAVGIEIAHAAELLLRISPFPHGKSHLELYRREFEVRYGLDRQVPLLELLDANFGLGLPSGYRNDLPVAPQEPTPSTSSPRRDTLLSLAVTALRDRLLEVELDEETCARLQTWHPTTADAPPSLELYAFVTADSAAEVDAGHFQVILGPNLGASQAGRTLGRFADVLAPEGQNALAHIASYEQTRAAQASAPESRGARQLWAELVFVPTRLRAANVTVHPATRQYELVLGTSAGVPYSRVIPFDELVVGVRTGRFYVHWPRLNADIVICAGHMLNPRLAPGIGRFLSEVSWDTLPQLSAFEWGPAAGLPFLPRLRVGRIILRPAQWRIDLEMWRQELATSDRSAFLDRLQQWRSKWNVPRYVFITENDNRLLLDLESKWHSEQLRQEGIHLSSRGVIYLQEALPEPARAWVQGPAGHYVAEYVASVVVRAPAIKNDEKSQTPGPEAITAQIVQVQTPRAPLTQYLRPPGADWLYAKLYCGRAMAEDLLLDHIAGFARQVLERGMAEEWFFVRYTDPDFHIRVRFHGKPDLLLKELVPALCAWADTLVESGMISRLAIDTYDREVERYGGEAATCLAESLFAQDSQEVIELLRLLRGKTVTLDRTLLAVLSVDNLLAGLGLDITSRVDWYRKGTGLAKESAAAYRERKAELRALLREDEYLGPQQNGADLAQVFAHSRQALAPIAGELDAQARRGELTQERTRLYGSYIHMHCNRLLGIDRDQEMLVLGLARRTREGLEHSR